MNTTELMKKQYVSPKLICTRLDNSISLELQSVDPPAGPGEGNLQKTNAPEYFNNNPLNA